MEATTPAVESVLDETPAPPSRRAAHWWRHPDVRCVGILVAIPLVVFVVPALFGYPAIAGDNLLQNFPLRALSGRLMAEGHLPLWNKYIWSGSPLLGGLNAGSFYPFTALFIVFAPVAAWVMNLLLAYWAAAIGVYALLRQYRLARLACLLAAATYAFGGPMAGQMVHLPIIQGWGWIPFMVLAQLRLSWQVFDTGPRGTVPARRGSAWPWVVLLAVTLAMMLLTGEPRSIATAELVALVVVAWQVLRRYDVAVTWRQRGVYLAWSVLGGIWGGLLAAMQLLPGLSFIDASQRAVEGYSFFGSGSFKPSWSVLLLVPDIFGGDGILHQPAFFNTYNLPEVTAYVGLLPLCAVVACATVAFGRRRDERSADLWFWLFLTVVGILAAFGEYTPLGGLFGHIPFFDRTRLQSRNLGIASLGMAALLGFWADRLLGGDTTAAALDGWRRWVTAFPPIAAALTCIAAIAIPVTFETAFGVAPWTAGLGVPLRPWLWLQLAVAAGAIVLLVSWRRIGPRARRRLLGAFVGIDLLVFTAVASTGLTPGQVTVTPSPDLSAAVLGTNGRFGIYDTSATNSDELTQIGQPDLNVFNRATSVNGYSALVAGNYGTVTGAHTLDDLDSCALERGVFTQLRLATLLTLPEFVAPLLRPDGVIGSQGRAAPPSPPESCPGAPRPGTAHQRTFWLGQTLELTSAHLTHQGRGTGSLAVAVVRPGGAIAHPPVTVVRVKDGWSVHFTAPSVAIGLVVTGAARSVSDQSTVSAGQRSYSLDGELQDALGQAGWSSTPSWNQYAVFRQRLVRPPVWLAAAAPGASVRQVSATDWGSETDAVRAPSPLTVVRSEAYLDGWRVEAVSASGRTRSLPVEAHGLIQSVRVPAGSWTITFLYRAKGTSSGLALSGIGALGLVAVAAGALVRRRRKGGPLGARDEQ